MTRDPICLGRHDKLEKARRRMHDGRLRHIVIVDDDGRIEGLVSERDLNAIERYRDVDPARVELHEALAPVVYRAEADAPLTQVCTEMAEQRIGSAVVCDRGRLVGIFTTTDALRALARLAR